MVPKKEGIPTMTVDGMIMAKVVVVTGMVEVTLKHVHAEAISITILTFGRAMAIANSSALVTSKHAGEIAFCKMVVATGCWRANNQFFFARGRIG